MSNQTDFWTKYYAELLEEPAPWLDYSNDKVQAQSLALALESAGAIRTRRCLDFGCGRGQLARALHVLGASRVVGIDGMESLLAENRENDPAIEWQLSTASEDHLGSEFDLMCFIEVLQLLPSLDLLDRHWARLTPGGRMIGLLSNAECPIASKVAERFDGHYLPRHFDELVTVAGRLEGVERVGIRGLTFQEDQLIAPYKVSDWAHDRWTSAEPPNRWQFVFVKSGAG